MLMLPESVRIYLATAPADMRRGFDGLSALVTNELDEDIYSGHLFVFINRRGDRVKILTWDRGGFVLWYRRLERGRFRIPLIDPEQCSVTLDAGELAMLLEGLDYSQVRRPRRWHPPARRAA
jgi:transposase